MEQGSVILISGGTGLIGKAMTHCLLEEGHQVIILSRQVKKPKKDRSPQLRYATWDPAGKKIDPQIIQQADYIIHLAGAGIADKRWTEKRKKVIVESRVQAGETLVNALQQHSHNVKAFISASAIGWYGPDKDEIKAFIETDPPADDFLGRTVQQWEQSVDPLEDSGIRLVKFRIGPVLSTEGGALAEFIKPVRFGLATILGNGKQVFSWIHIDDLTRMFLYALENEKLHGVYNAVSPNPVTNKQLMQELAKRMKGSFFVPLHVPSWGLRAALGEMSIEVLKSATVSSSRIKNAGFVFRYPTIESALKQLIQ